MSDQSLIADVPSTNHGLSLLQLKIANTVAFIVTIAMNGLSSTGILSSNKIGEISRKYPTKITPAGGAFSIWGVIYTIEALFVLYQFWWPQQDKGQLLHGVGFWFIGACLFNSLWIVTFVQGNDVAVWCSTFLILGLLASLCKIYLKAACWKGSRPGGVLQTLVLDVHISMYAGWVTVASIVNVTILLTTVVDAASATASTCSVVMLVIALLLNLIIVVTRGDCVWGWVLAWASYYISVANEDNDAVRTTSLVVGGIIGLVSAVVGVRTAVAFIKARKAGTLA